MKRFILAWVAMLSLLSVVAQNTKIYDESIDPFAQIDQAVAQANQAQKLVVCQLGGNWCPWCIKFAKFIQDDEEIRTFVEENFVYIHVNYKSRQDELAQKVSSRLGNAGRFGFPVLVVLNQDGSVLHIQNSAYLEEGQGYNRDKVLDFFKQWTLKSISGGSQHWGILTELPKADLNAPFGWATCNTMEGGSFPVAGGKSVTAPKTIVLKSNRKDQREEILKAILENDIIVFDGSEGDFIMSEIIRLNALSHKTLVGINQARICTQFSVSKEIQEQLTAANVPEASTSGNGGTLSNGQRVGEEAEFLTRKMLLEKYGNENYRNAGLFYIAKCSDIIIRNLKLVGPGSIDVGGADLLSCVESNHVWVDHCDFTDGMDGNFDITRSSDFCTVSWCTFSYTDRSYMHQNTNLVGSSDREPTGHLNITFAYNVWGRNCRARMPMARAGHLHMLNNYYDCKGNLTPCINPRKNSHFLIEGNYFEKGVTRIFAQKDAIAYVWSDDNVAVEAFERPENLGEMTVPYSYNVQPAKELPALLTAHAGATLADSLNY